MNTFAPSLALARLPELPTVAHNRHDLTNGDTKIVQFSPGRTDGDGVILSVSSLEC